MTKLSWCRFCSSCGYKYKLERVENILQKAYKCKHRQIVFTIPKELREYFFFPFENRINILFESLNRQFRKYTKTKSVFPTDMSLLKYLYLSTKNIQKKWTRPYRNWGPILNELSIMFDGKI